MSTEIPQGPPPESAYGITRACIGRCWICEVVRGVALTCGQPDCRTMGVRARESAINILNGRGERGQAFAAYVEAKRPEFGGRYFEPSGSSGVVTILFTRNLEQHETALSPMFPAAVDVRVRLVQHSYQDLLDLAETIRADMLRLHAAGVAPMSWGPNVRTNHVEVRVAEPTTAMREAVARLYPSKPIVVTRGTRSILERHDGT